MKGRKLLDVFCMAKAKKKFSFDNGNASGFGVNKSLVNVWLEVLYNRF